MKKPDMFNGGKGYGFELEQYSVNGRAYSEQMICLMLAHCKLSFVKKVIKLIQQNVQPERGGVMAWKKKDDPFGVKSIRKQASRTHGTKENVEKAHNAMHAAGGFKVSNPFELKPTEKSHRFTGRKKLKAI
jgi:hypothetical protein